MAEKLPKSRWFRPESLIWAVIGALLPYAFAWLGRVAFAQVPVWFIAAGVAAALVLRRLVAAGLRSHRARKEHARAAELERREILDTVRTLAAERTEEPERAELAPSPAVRQTHHRVGHGPSDAHGQ